VSPTLNRASLYIQSYFGRALSHRKAQNTITPLYPHRIIFKAESQTLKVLDFTCVMRGGAVGVVTFVRASERSAKLWYIKHNYSVYKKSLMSVILLTFEINLVKSCLFPYFSL